MPTVVISIEPLTREAFAPYGDVVEVDGNNSFPINAGRADRYDALATVDRSDPGNNCVEHWFPEGEQPVLDRAGLKIPG